MTIASRLKLNIWLSTTVVFLMIVAFGAALLIQHDIRTRSLFADQLMRGAFELSLLSDYYVRHPEARPQRQWQQKHAVLLELLKDRHDDHGEQARLESIYQSLRDNGVLFQKLMGTYASGRSDDPLARPQREQLADLMIMRSRTVAEGAAQMGADTRAEMAAVTGQIGVAFPVLSLLVLALTIWSATRIRTSIAGPIEQLRQGAAIIGTGQLDHRIGLSSADELGELGGEFDRMAQRLKGITVSRDELMKEMAERQQAEAALQANKATLEAALASMTDAVFISDTEGRFIDFNDAFATFHKFRNKADCAKALADYPVFLDVFLANGEWAPLEQWAVPRALRGETATNAEYTLRRKDTGETWIGSYSFAPIRDQDGVIVGSVVAGRDITERKRTEQALRESEIRMRALLDASQEEILLLSMEGMVLAINKAAERRLAKRMGGDDPVGLHLDRLLPHDQVEWRMAIVQQVASMATHVHQEMEVRSRWFECWYYPVIHPDKPVSEVALYAREITEQKKSQAELSKLFQAIQQSPASVVITDRDGKIEYVNPKFTEVTGYTAAEAIGRNPRILKSGHTPAEQYSKLWETITSGGVWRGELLNKKKNGELLWELASIAAVTDGEKIINFVAVKEDITERKEIEEQLRQSQKMQAVGQLTGGIAHDFNNLLAIIMGNLQLLAELPSDAKAREYLDDALWSARRGGELTHRLLAFARKQPLKPATLDLNEAVRGMTDLLRRTLGASIRIEESLAPDLWKTFADQSELERALVNLAVNARDAMRAGGTLTLETRNAVLDEDYAEHYQEVTPGEYALLAVTDTGSGMPPETVQRVFEPFFTTKEVGQGSGLGLSMVYGFVKQSGGHISIYSRVGQGTSVKLYLPRSPSLPAQPEEASPDVLPQGFGGKVVLVVEDEGKLRKVAVKMLYQLGLRCLQAENARDALELLADRHVDVLFTDIELPGGMNGTELAEAAQKLTPAIKVLFTTGYAREAVLHDKWLHHKTPWLLKPYSHIELAHELKALLMPKVH